MLPPTAPFQSTRPVKGATWPNNLEELTEDVSIHAPREGRDGLHHNRLLKNGRIRHCARIPIAIRLS